MSKTIITRDEFFKLVDSVYQLAILTYPNKSIIELYNKIDYNKDFYFDTLQIIDNKVIFYFTDLYYIYDGDDVDEKEEDVCFIVKIQEKEKGRDKLYDYLIERKQLKKVVNIMTKIIFDLF